MVAKIKPNLLFIFFLFISYFMVTCHKKEKDEPKPIVLTTWDTVCPPSSKTWTVIDMPDINRIDYTFDNKKITSFSKYYNSTLIEKINFVYDENSNLIEQNYQNLNKLLAGTIAYKYNSNNQLIQSVQSTSIGILFNNPISTFFYYDNFGRISRVDQLNKQLTSYQIIYDEYNNIVEIRICSGKSNCSLYISYEYDYDVKPLLSWDNDWLVPTYSPHHFVHKETVYENGENK